VGGSRRHGGWLAVAVAVGVIALAAVATAAAVTVLDYDGSAPEPSAASREPLGFPRGPQLAILDLDAAGKRKWAGTLGAHCNLDRVSIMALGQDADGLDVVSMPGRCDVNRFHLSWDDGEITQRSTWLLYGSAR
jgi:hypothetical protein